MRPSAPPYLHRFRLGSRRSLMTNAPHVPGFRDAALSDDSGTSPLYSETRAPLLDGFRDAAARGAGARLVLCGVSAGALGGYTAEGGAASRGTDQDGAARPNGEDALKPNAPIPGVV